MSLFKQDNIFQTLFSQWEVKDGENEIKSLIRFICEDLMLKEFSVYSVAGEWFELQVSYQIDEAKEVDDTKHKLRTGEKDFYQDLKAIGDVTFLEEGNSESSALGFHCPQKLRFRETLKESFISNDPAPGVGFITLKSGDEVKGICLARFLKSNNYKPKTFKSIVELAPFILMVLDFCNKIEEQDKELVQLNREAKIGQLSLKAVMSLETIVETILAQCARSFHYTASIVGVKNKLGEFKIRYSWGLENFELSLDTILNETLVEIEIFGDQSIVLSKPDEELAKLNIASLLAVPLNENASEILILISTTIPTEINQKSPEIFNAFAEQLKSILEREQKFKEFEEGYIKSLDTTVNCIELSRESLRGHHNRVHLMTKLIANEFDFKAEDMELLLTAAKYHDIGLLGGRDAVLSASLEFQHPVLGEAMIQPLNSGEKIGQIILQHHETYDGFGFPSSLSGDEISLEGQILAQAEVIVERTTYNGLYPASSIQEYADKVKGEAGVSLSLEVADKITIALNKLTSVTFSGGDCVKYKGCPSDICEKCPAKNLSFPCWELDKKERKCNQHGDADCENCFVFRTWGKKVG